MREQVKFTHERLTYLEDQINLTVFYSLPQINSFRDKQK